MVTTFYNKHGVAIFYTEDQEHLYLYTGTPVGYFRDDSVYSFSGRHLGRFTDGWIRDNSGACVFFTEDASGGPVRPVRGIRPVRGVRGVKPVKGVRSVKPVRPVKSTSWSQFTSKDFFEQ